MKTNTFGAKFLIVAVAAVAGTLGLHGCADYAAVGVTSGYYAPDYRPYYVDYGYDGYPYWGLGPYYAGTIVVKDRDRDIDIHRKVVKNIKVIKNVNRNVYYGGHHLSPSWHGGGVVAGRPVRRGWH
jgi:hypothetical protein